MPLTSPKSLFLCSFFAGLLLAASAAAQGAALSAEDIAKRVLDHTGFRWEGAETQVKMILVDKGGARKERQMRVLGRRHAGRFEAVVKVLAPADVSGTGFLMKETAGGGSEQHVYLPGLKRLRRITGRDRAGSFMNSDFTYADLQRVDMRGAKHRRLADAAVGPMPAYVIESLPPPDSKVPYSRVKTWVRQNDYVPLQTEFYGPDGKLVKTLRSLKIRQIDGRLVVVEARMTNANGHATELVVEDLKRRDDLPDTAFTPAALER